MALYLAIDAGGTKTQCVLADDTHVLARAETGTVKLMRIAEALASARLRRILVEAAAAAGVSLDQVRRTCFGLAGSRSESVQQWARGAIATAGVGGEILICGDEAIALDAAFRSGPGILVIAGTGSHAIGRADDGTVFNAGGWGPVLGDEGSGYWIGLEALRAALRARDEGDDSAGMALLHEIEREWGMGSLGELVALGNLRAPCETTPPPDFAALAPVIARSAESGNALAGEVLRRAGEELAELVMVVYRKMGAATKAPTDVFEAKIEVAFTGSVLANIAPVRAAMRSRLSAMGCHAAVREGSVDSLDGALWRARCGV